MHHDDAAGALGDVHDRVDVERRERAQVDDADLRAAPLAARASAASTAVSTIAPQVMTTASAASRTIARATELDEVLAVGNLVRAVR